MTPDDCRSTRAARRSGFTLIELIVVLAIVALLTGIADADIVGVNIPNGIPLVYELDAALKPIKSYYLGDAEAAAKAAAAVAAQAGGAPKV